MNYYEKSEWKLGLFIAGGIVLFLLLIFALGSLKLLERGYEVKVLFRFANGIDVGAPVRLAGVKIGEVKNVRIIYSPQDEKPLVELTLKIRKDTKIRQNATVLINILGLLGEKYVEILPGSTKALLLKNGDVIIGHDSIPLAKLSDFGYEIAKKLDETIDSIKDIISGEENKESIQTTLHNFKNLTANLNNLILDSDQLVEKINNGEGTIGKLLVDDTLYKDLEEFVKDIKTHPWKLLRKPRRRKRK
jgi:phospholipid/cholesterol/gamma-HCH transport system substrate-binding protein